MMMKQMPEEWLWVAIMMRMIHIDDENGYDNDEDDNVDDDDVDDDDADAWGEALDADKAGQEGDELLLHLLASLLL